MPYMASLKQSSRPMACGNVQGLARENGMLIMAHTPLTEMVMLLRGLTWLVLFQLLGTGLNHLLLPVLPGPIIGLVLLLGYLMVRGQVAEPLQVASASLLRYLPLLLVPPAVGVMVYAPDIAADFWAITGALVISVLVAMGFAGWLMQYLMRRQRRARNSQ
jgi:holin-like protein